MTGSARSPSTGPKNAKGWTDERAHHQFERGNSWPHRRRNSLRLESNSPCDDEIPLKSFNRRDSRFEPISDEDDTDDETMARPPMHRPTDGRSQVPLLKEERRGRQSSTGSFLEEGRGVSSGTRRSTLRSRTPVYDTKNATRRKYMIASFFLIVCLVSFTVQTQTAVFIQQELGWNKPYCML